MANIEIVEGIPEGAERDAFHRYLQIGCTSCVNCVTLEFTGMKDDGTFVAAVDAITDTNLPHRALTINGDTGRDSDVRVGGVDCREACRFEQPISDAVQAITGRMF